MKRVKVGKNYETIVDDDIAELLKLYRLSPHVQKNGRCYVQMTLQPVYLHRFIMDLRKGDGKIVDHINHDGLDNRRRNLRVCTNTQNSRWARRSLGVSGYRGVTQKGSRFTVRVSRKWVGSFPDAISAARAYDQKVTEMYGQFAKRNFPN